MPTTGQDRENALLNGCTWLANRKHGTAAAFRYGCRCSSAREAWRLYRRRRAQGRDTSADLVDATGAARRLRALTAMGYSQTDLARELGWKGVQMVVRTMVTKRVTRTTAERVSEAYERLCMVPGPSSLAAARARRAGWAPPLAWDEGAIDDPAAKPIGLRRRKTAKPKQQTEVDQAAVVRATAGDTVELTIAERQAAILILARRGHNDAEIARQLRVTPRAVVRIRTKAGIAPGVRRPAVPQVRLADVLHAAVA